MRIDYWELWKLGVAFQIVTVCSCSRQAGLPVGSIYRGIDEEPTVRVISSTELELTMNNDRLVCEYSRDADRIRVLFVSAGSKRVLYFMIVPQGLEAEDGSHLYLPDPYEQTMREVRAEREARERQTKLEETLNEGQPIEVRLARAAVGRNGPIGKALESYKWDKGRFPSSNDGLVALYDAKNSVGDEKNHGPYMMGTFDELKDPWGNPFIYKFPGERNKDCYDLYSMGPDGHDDRGKLGSDDIKNWIEE